MFRKTILMGLMAVTALGSVAPAYAQRSDNDHSGAERGRGGPDYGDAGRGDRGRGDSDRGQGWQRGGEGRGSQPQGDRGAQWRGGMGQRFEQPQSPQSPQVQSPQRAPDDRRGWQQSHSQQDRWQQQPGAVQRDWRQDNRGDRHGDPRTDWRNQSRDDRRNGAYTGRQNDWRDRSNDGWNNGGVNNRWQNNARRYDDRTRWSSQQRWDNGWRNDRRYDWQSYRSRYGGQYRAGRYYAPRGWDYGYRRFSVGIFLSNILYSNNYWLSDPYSYRLPPAYGTLRWVRYYDDALLVDVRDGYVVDVIHDFFF